jgi:hypothetical protein
MQNIFISLEKCQVSFGGIFGWVDFPCGGGYGTQGLAHIRGLNSGLAN